MSERRHALLLGVALLLACGAPRTVAGQSAAEWEARLVDARTRFLAADTAWRRADGARDARRTARFTAGGRTVRYAPSELTAADSARLARGLKLGRARLLERFGDEGLSLIDTVTWSVALAPARYRLTPTIIFRRASQSLADLTRPVDPERVARFVLMAAGSNLAYLSPALAGIAGNEIPLVDEPERYALAAREMALSWAAAGRHCSIGSIAACRAVITPSSVERGLTLHFEPSDWRAVVTAGRVPTTSDSAFFAERRACLAGDDAACAVAVTQVGVPEPFSGGLRATFVSHAIARGGRDALARLRATEAADPIAALASVAGMPEDSLIASWQRQTARALADERGSSFPLALSVSAWSVLALLGATRRRPT